MNHYIRTLIRFIIKYLPFTNRKIKSKHKNMQPQTKVNFNNCQTLRILRFVFLIALCIFFFKLDSQTSLLTLGKLSPILMTAIIFSERNNLFAQRSENLMLASSPNPIMVDFVDTVVSANDLTNYFEQNNSGHFTGLRFHCALNQENALVLLVSRSGINTGVNSDYCILDINQVINPSTPFPESITEIEAQTMIQRFYTGVLVEGQVQNSGNDMFKKSRFHYWEDIRQLIRANLPLSPEDPTNPMAGFFIKIEHGYMTSAMANNFNTEYDCYYLLGVTMNEFMGYTIMLCMTDRYGVSIINDGASPNGTDYQGRFLEGSNPCPRMC